MDNVDLELLAALERNARLSFAELAEMHVMTKTPVWKRVKALEEAGVIAGYAALLDPASLGFDIQAFVQITLDFEGAERFEKAVFDHPAVWHCHATTGAGDYLLHIVATDVSALDTLLRQEIARMPGVRRTETVVATRTIKADHALASAAKRLRG